MRVGIVTWFGHINYGQNLQAFAMQAVLEKLGHEPEFIVEPRRYRGAAAFLLKKTLRLPLSLMRYVARLMSSRTRRRADVPVGVREGGEVRRAAFDGFVRRYLKISPRRYVVASDILRDPPQYDAYVCGSDQIWNPKMVSSKEMFYFLRFAPEKKRIAYAPSFAVDKIRLRKKWKYKKYIRSIPHLSVRESRGVEIVKNLTGRDARWVLDPTMLLTPSDWERFLAPGYPLKPSGPYVFCYFLGDTEYLRAMRSVCGLLGAEPVVVHMREEAPPGGATCVYDAGPLEFVDLIRGAAYVLTDSFHGAVLSILFNRPFYVFDRDNGRAGRNSMASRLISLLSKTGFEDRMISDRDITALDTADFTRANLILEKERESSLTYLARALESVCKDTASGGVRTEPAGVDISRKESCSGCSACAQACPSGCVAMKPDAEGFLYPKTDGARCVSCGACRRACPMAAAGKALPKEPPGAYACVASDDDLRLRSSSGGVFALLAGRTLDLGGVVFGAGYEKDLSVAHMPAQNREALRRLMGSKYVQSRIGDTYGQVKRHLAAGRQVLFSGTPCQTAGLNAFLGGEHENLLTVDLICHGAPSPEVFKRYIEAEEARNGGGVTEVNFRDKATGWEKYGVTIGFGGVKKSLPFTDDKYMLLFLNNVILRPSCHECRFKRGGGRSDITLGDYWGVSSVHPELDDDKGVSLALVNSRKGALALSSMKERLKIVETDRSKALSFNPAYDGSAPVSPKRARFFSDFARGEKVFSAIPRYARKTGLLKRAVSKLLRIVGFG